MNVTGPSIAGVPLVLFLLDERRYAVDLERVERVLPRVAMAPFPKAPAIVSGVFDLQGELVPVVNVRRRFGLPARPPALSDRFLLVRTARRRLVLAVDSVEPVIEAPAAAMTDADTLVPGLEHVRGIVRLPALGIVFVQDLDRFLSLEEEARLDAALVEGAP